MSSGSRTGSRLPHLRGDFGGKRLGTWRRRMQGWCPSYQPRRRPLHHPLLAPLPAAPVSASYVTPYYPFHSRPCGPAPPARPARRMGSRRYAVAYACLTPRKFPPPSSSGAKFPSSETRTYDTAKSDFTVELEVPGWSSRTCPSRGIQNERKPFF